MVNMAMRCGNDRWKKQDVAWFDMETMKEGEILFFNVALVDNKTNDRSEEEGLNCIRAEEE
jgi:hypothetical protein